MDSLLAHLFASGCVGSFDLMLGQQIQDPYGKDASLISIYAAKAFRLGHMAIRWDHSHLQPAPQEVFSDEGLSVLDDRTLSLIDQTLRQELEERKFGRLIVEGEWLALPQAHAIEGSLADELVRLSSAPCALSAGRIPDDEPLNKDQRAAVEGAFRHTVCTIMGGPGTGKTYTAGRLLRALALVNPSLRVALTAPTGRAVQTLEASIRAVLTDVAIDAKTIHSLVSGPSLFLPYHAVIIDECSMIDSQMLLALTKRLHDGTKIILLGDSGQLPPIEPGQPFFDLATTPSLRHIGRYTLSECQRTGSSDLIEFARLVRQGDPHLVDEWISESRNDVQFINCSTSNEWNNAWTTIEEMAIHPWESELTIQQAQELQKKTIVLTPTRKGPLGSDEINRRARGGGKRPVISLQNVHQLGVMNGDLGVLERHPVVDYIHFPRCTVPAIVCPKIEQAFAMTVHKSQGSEFERVILVLPPGALLDQRLFYTAVTRARRQVLIMGSKEDLLGAIGRRHDRVSTLQQRMH